MSTRKLPLGVYPSPTSGERYIAAIRHEGARHYLGSFGTIKEASDRIHLFRQEHPKTTKAPWQPGDKL